MALFVYVIVVRKHYAELRCRIGIKMTPLDDIVQFSVRVYLHEILLYTVAYN